jgi:hypothetical protein
LKNLIIGRILLLSLFSVAFNVFSQNTNPAQEEKKWTFKFGGFVKTDVWYDSRQITGSREDMFLFYPKNISKDKNGKDINAKGTWNLSAISTRASVLIGGPDAFGAKTTGYIETDFTGMANTDIDGLRLRHAYVKMKWEKSELLIGQYWHPMFVPDCFPQVISLNTGAPFHPFIRNPQITFTKNFKKLNVIISAISQRDNSNDGPESYSNNYIRNSLVPNGHLQLQYKGEKNIFGIAGDYKVLQPRIVTDSNYVTNEKVSSYAFMAYWKYTKSKFIWRCKAIYGQNLTEHLMMGGYAIKTYDSATATATYTPTNHLFVMGNVFYGNKIQIGLFGGYIYNFGTTDSNTGKYYARGSDIAYMYRIAPSISFKSGSTQFSAEFEYTVAAFGKPDKYGLVQNPKEVGNMRILLTAYYFF